MANALSHWLAGWLKPHGAMADSTDVIGAIHILSQLPTVLQRTTLYGWRRFMLDRAWRGIALRDLQKTGLKVDVLANARPGTGLWRILEERVHHVLGHDDTIERVFPMADPALLCESSPRPEVRCVRIPVPGPKVSRHALLSAVQVLVGISVIPTRRKDDPRAKVGRLVIIDPPPELLHLLESFIPAEWAVPLVIITRQTVYSTPPERWFGATPAVLVQRSLGEKTIAVAGRIEPTEAQRLLLSSSEGDLLFAHQRGSPVARWTTVRPVHRLPQPVPGALASAFADGQRRYAIPRAEVIHNRERLESHVELRTRRAATADVLQRTLGPDRLTEGWRRTKRNKGVAGTDGVTVEQFEMNWNGAVQALASEVRHARYRPHPLLRVWRDKASGGKRPIGIPSVRDRVLMSAATEVLGAVLDPTFSDRSHAYRPERGARTAIAAIAGAPGLAEGWAIVSDIASYFDTIDHRLLLAMLREHVSDEPFLRLILQWLQNPVRENGLDHAVKMGVPQGCSISPVLANLYLTPLDRWMERRGLAYARYADDFVAVCPTEATAAKISAELEAFLARELKLSIKPTKTTFVSMTEGFDFLGFRIAAAGLAIAPGRTEECIDAMRAQLAGSAAPEHLRDFDGLVRGFRNYFDLPYPHISRQFEQLETVRRTLLEEWCAATRTDPRIVHARAEQFCHVSEPEARLPTGRYPDAERTQSGAAPPEQPLPLAVQTSLAIVDRSPQAVRDRAADARPAAALAGGHLAIFGFAISVGIEGERIIVRRKKELVFESPLTALRSVHLQTYGMAVTTPLLEKLSQLDIPVLFSHPNGKVWGAMRGNVHRGSGELLAAQLACRAGPLSIHISKALLAAKLVNQERLLRYYAKYSARKDGPIGQALREGAEAIVRLRTRLEAIDEPDVASARKRLFSTEGRAGAAYWQGLKSVFGDHFPGRTGRGASDPINVALNYGYGILYGAIWCAVLRAGLEPGIGVLHAAPGDRAALVFDLIEPFRVPVVDRPILSVFAKGGTIKLNKDGHLSATSRRKLAKLIGASLDREVPWGGTPRSLAAHIEQHAAELAACIMGGKLIDPLRIRW